MPKPRRAGESDICERGETSFCYQLREPSHSLSQSLRKADEAVVAAWVAETGSARLWPVVVLCEPWCKCGVHCSTHRALSGGQCLSNTMGTVHYIYHQNKLDQKLDVLYHFYNLVPDLLKSVQAEYR